MHASRKAKECFRRKENVEGPLACAVRGWRRLHSVDQVQLEAGGRQHGANATKIQGTFAPSNPGENGGQKDGGRDEERRVLSEATR